VARGREQSLKYSLNGEGAFPLGRMLFSCRWQQEGRGPGGTTGSPWDLSRRNWVRRRLATQKPELPSSESGQQAASRWGEGTRRQCLYLSGGVGDTRSQGHLLLREGPGSCATCEFRCEHPLRCPGGIEAGQCG
jgi:hypothetical protein